MQLLLGGLTLDLAGIYWLGSVTRMFAERQITEYILYVESHSHITLQPKTGCPLKLSRAEPGQYLDRRPPVKTRLLLEEVLVRPAGGAHPVICVGPNAPV